LGRRRKGFGLLFLRRGSGSDDLFHSSGFLSFRLRWFDHRYGGSCGGGFWGWSCHRLGHRSIRPSTDGRGLVVRISLKVVELGALVNVIESLKVLGVVMGALVVLVASPLVTGSLIPVFPSVEVCPLLRVVATLIVLGVIDVVVVMVAHLFALRRKPAERVSFVELVILVVLLVVISVIAVASVVGGFSAVDGDLQFLIVDRHSGKVAQLGWL